MENENRVMYNITKLINLVTLLHHVSFLQYIETKKNILVSSVCFYRSASGWFMNLFVWLIRALRVRKKMTGDDSIIHMIGDILCEKVSLAHVFNTRVSRTCRSFLVRRTKSACCFGIGRRLCHPKLAPMCDFCYSNTNPMEKVVWVKMRLKELLSFKTIYYMFLILSC